METFYEVKLMTLAAEKSCCADDIVVLYEKFIKAVEKEEEKSEKVD